MTFSQKIKAELCHIQYDITQKQAIVSAFFANNLHLFYVDKALHATIKSKNFLTIRFLLTLIDDLFKNNNLISYNRIKDKKSDKKYLLTFTNGSEIVINQLNLFTNPYNWLVKNKTRNCYLTGLFLANGSINNPTNSNYHFQLIIYNNVIFNVVQKIFQQLEIDFGFVTKTNSYLLYVKKAEAISDILKLLNVNESMFEFEDKRITRDFSSQLSRLNNLDVSNIKKATEASHNQIIEINFLKEKHLYENLNLKEKQFCILRQKYQNASISELVTLFKQQYQIKISKSGINHIIRKIHQIYLTNN